MVRKARAPPAPERRSARENKKGDAPAEGVSHARDGVAEEAQEDNPLDDDPGVTSKKMTWRMLLASADGMRAADGITAQSGNANSIHEDSADYQYLRQERDEQAEVERASAEVGNMEECLWCSDTTSAALEQSFGVRVQQVANGAQARTFMKGGRGGPGHRARVLLRMCLHVHTHMCIPECCFVCLPAGGVPSAVQGASQFRARAARGGGTEGRPASEVRQLSHRLCAGLACFLRVLTVRVWRLLP